MIIDNLADVLITAMEDVNVDLINEHITSTYEVIFELNYMSYLLSHANETTISISVKGYVSWEYN